MKKIFVLILVFGISLNVFPSSTGTSTNKKSEGDGKVSTESQKIELWNGAQENLNKFSFGSDFGVDVKYVKDNIAKFSVISDEKWGKAFMYVQGYDVDKYPYLEVVIDSVDKDSNIQIKATIDWDDQFDLLGRTFYKGTKVLSIKKETGWKGVKDFILVVYIEGYVGKAVSLVSISGTSENNSKK